MLMSYVEAEKEYGSQYQLARAVAEGRVYKLEDGIYSENSYEPELSIIMKKYPKAVLAGESAYYYHNLTDVIPEKYDLATSSKASKITDPRIRQIYVREDLFPLGAVTEEHEGNPIRIYDKERMLIELLRSKNSMPYDLYKEILTNYRMIISNLQLWRIQEYATEFPKSKMISKALDSEVL